MTETKDKKTRIYRHEYSTVTPAKCKEHIEQYDGIKQRFYGNNVSRYIAEYDGKPIEIRLSPTRVIIFGTNRYAMLETAKLIHFEEWEYDNTTERTDYISKGGTK